MIRLKNISFISEKDKSFNLKIGEIAIPPYVMVGALIVVGIAIYIRGGFS